MGRNVIIFDLDGTLADGSMRLHLLPKEEDRGNDKAWEVFNTACDSDFPIWQTCDIMQALYLSGIYDIVILTGRGSVARKKTEEWLQQWDINYDALYMRPIGDCRPDYEFKEELIRTMLGIENVIACFDDSPSVVKHFRNMGLTVYQVCDYE